MTNEENIIALFNRTELRDGESIIDNRDSTIAKELGLNLSVTTKCITKYLDEKFEIINNRDVVIEESESFLLINALNQVKSLKSKLNLMTKRYNSIYKKRLITCEDTDRLTLLKEMIIKKERTKEIYVSLNFASYAGLWHFVKGETGLKYSEYKKQLLKTK